MTMETATKMWSTQGCNLETEDGASNRVRITESYQQVSTDGSDELAQVVLGPGLPQLNDPYPGTPEARVRKVIPKRKSLLLWQTQVVYEGESPGVQLGHNGVPFAGSPLLIPPKIRFGKTETMITVEEDRNGNAIVNTNGELIHGGVQKERSDLTLTIERNYADIDLATTLEYFDSVNSDEFYGFQPGLARMTAFDAEKAIDETVGGYFRVTAGFAFRVPYNTTDENAWASRKLHKGFMVDDGAGNVRRARDGEGNFEAQPVMLKPDGTRETNNEVAHYIDVQVYTPLPYNSLGLLS